MSISKSSKKKITRVLADIFDMLSFLIFVGGIVLFVRFFIANPYTVVGASMAPTFEEKDFIIVDKITPRFGEWQRGDIIVFVPPGKDVPYIKRIIALPGETVEVKNGGIMICHDENDLQLCDKLDESYLPENLKTEARCGQTIFKVEGGLFVMGDNRGFSTDSLCCFGLGCYEGANYVVPFEYIIGKVYVRLFPHFGQF